MQKDFLKVYGVPLFVVFLFASAFFGGFVLGQNNVTNPVDGLNIKNNFDLTITGSTTDSIDMKQFWETWKILDKKFVATKSAKPATNQEKLYGAIQGMTSAFGDPYTVFMPPEEAKSFDEDISGGFEGVGMEVGQKDGILTVIAPLKGTPAERAGILPGDKIITINGSSTQDISVDAAVKLIRGPKGTEVTFKIAREGNNDYLEKKVTRDVINIPTVATEQKDGVFIIHLYNFYAQSANLFRGALKEFLASDSDKMILDLRGNPGGYLESAVDMASWFLPLGKVIVREVGSDEQDEKIHRANGHQIFTDKLKLVILANEGSASASEILAGALRDHGLAQIVGTKTFGKGSVQEVVKIGENSNLKVTIARWLTPNGYSISESGLKPDFEVKITEEDRVKGRDPQMIKALEVINK
ncbi:MAG: S41 family peptidase [Minisyncoccia bacterium]